METRSASPAAVARRFRPLWAAEDAGTNFFRPAPTPRPGIYWAHPMAAGQPPGARISDCPRNNSRRHSNARQIACNWRTIGTARGTSGGKKTPRSGIVAAEYYRAHTDLTKG